MVNQTDSVNEAATSLELEGQLVDRALDSVLSLPQELQQMVSVQKLHKNEIIKYEKQLYAALGEEKQAAERNDTVIQEISSIDEKTYFIKEAGKLKHKSCQIFYKEIRALVSDIEALRNKTDHKKKTIQEEEGLFEEYRKKAEKYKEAIFSHEMSTRLHRTYIGLQQSVDKLRQEITELKQADVFGNKGDYEKDTELQIENIKHGIEGKQREASSLRLLIEKERMRKSAISKNVHVLEKRNSAQLLRIKKQIKEAQQRNNSWNNQIEQLQKNISQLQEKINAA